MEGAKEGRTLRFSIDRGGTFTDVFAEVSVHMQVLASCTPRCVATCWTHSHGSEEPFVSSISEVGAADLQVPLEDGSIRHRCAVHDDSGLEFKRAGFCIIVMYAAASTLSVTVWVLRSWHAATSWIMTCHSRADVRSLVVNAAANIRAKSQRLCTSLSCACCATAL